MSGSPVWIMSAQAAARTLIPAISAGSNQINCATCVCEVGTLPESIRHSVTVLPWIEQLVWCIQASSVATPLLHKHPVSLCPSVHGSH